MQQRALRVITSLRSLCVCNQGVHTDTDFLAKVTLTFDLWPENFRFPNQCVPVSIWSMFFVFVWKIPAIHVHSAIITKTEPWYVLLDYFKTRWMTLHVIEYRDKKISSEWSGMKKLNAFNGILSNSTSVTLELNSTSLHPRPETPIFGTDAQQNITWVSHLRSSTILRAQPMTLPPNRTLLHYHP